MSEPIHASAIHWKLSSALFAIYVLATMFADIHFFRFTGPWLILIITDALGAVACCLIGAAILAFPPRYSRFKKK